MRTPSLISVPVSCPSVDVMGNRGTSSSRFHESRSPPVPLRTPCSTLKRDGYGWQTGQRGRSSEDSGPCCRLFRTPPSSRCRPCRLEVASATGSCDSRTGPSRRRDRVLREKREDGPGTPSESARVRVREKNSSGQWM